MDNSGEKRFAEYRNFAVDSEFNGYRLTVDGYSGDAGRFDISAFDVTAFFLTFNHNGHLDWFALETLPDSLVLISLQELQRTLGL